MNKIYKVLAMCPLSVTFDMASNTLTDMLERGWIIERETVIPNHVSPQGSIILYILSIQNT